MTITIACIIGTRPEAIKMAPVILALRQQPWARTVVVATAQHRELADEVLELFGIKPDHDLNLMQANQTLPALTARAITHLDAVMDESGTDKTEDRFDGDVALSTGLLGPLLDSLIEALGGEMEIGTAMAPTAAAPTHSSSATASAEAEDDDPPF